MEIKAVTAVPQRRNKVAPHVVRAPLAIIYKVARNAEAPLFSPPPHTQQTTGGRTSRGIPRQGTFQIYIRTEGRRLELTILPGEEELLTN